MSFRRGGHIPLFSFLLLAVCASLMGCQSTGGKSGSGGFGNLFNPSKPPSSADQDLKDKLDSAQQTLSQTKTQADQALAQTSQLQKQLQGQKDIQTLLQQRVDNLLKENQQLHQELTSVVMSGSGDSDAAASNAIQNVSSTTRVDAVIPDSIQKSLAALADHHAGVQFDAKESAVRISDAELFSQGDELRDTAKSTLKELAGILASKDAQKFNYLIVAHAPPNASVPRELVALYPTVWHMTAHQAIAVEQFLEETGLSPIRVGIVSYAGQQPLVTGDDDASKRTNSRVEIFFTPPDPQAK
jgi:chemotaxis protein MotB